MKRTLQVVAAALALASVSVTAQAQGGGGGGGGGGRGNPAAQRAALFEGITLTADQQVKVDTAYAQATAKMMELRKDIPQGTQMTDEQRQKSQAINADRTKAIKAILTAEQNAIFDKNVEKMAAARRPPPSL
jgi:Spy/CpxP family protein refolding chaperone